MRRKRKVNPIEKRRNIRCGCSAVGTVEIAIRLKKTLRGLVFLMASIRHDVPLGKSLLTAAILQTFPAYCCLTEVTYKRGK